MNGMSKLLGVKDDNGRISIFIYSSDGFETPILEMSIGKAKLLVELLTAALEAAKGGKDD